MNSVAGGRQKGGHQSQVHPALAGDEEPRRRPETASSSSGTPREVRIAPSKYAILICLFGHQVVPHRQNELRVGYTDRYHARCDANFTFRDHYVTFVEWKDDRYVLIAWSNRPQNMTILTLCDAISTDCHVVSDISSVPRESSQEMCMLFPASTFFCLFLLFICSYSENVDSNRFHHPEIAVTESEHVQKLIPVCNFGLSCLL